MTPADVDPIAATFLRDDWGDRRLNLEFVAAIRGPTRSSPRRTARRRHGHGHVNGPVAWIGTICVDPAWRRRGVGLAITRATIDAAEAAGSRTLVLVATEAGRPMYETARVRRVQSVYRILEAPGLPATRRGRSADRVPYRAPATLPR